MLLPQYVFRLLRLCFASRAHLAAENLALRHQLGVMRRRGKRPRLRRADRILWVWLSRLWGGWRGALVIARPATVVRWHRQGWRLYWHWKSRPRKTGRQPVAGEIRELIQRMARENPTWGAPRIHGELRKLGIRVAQSTVAKHMPRRDKPPSAPWRAFLKNHASDFAACDFLTVPTLAFGVMYVFVVLRHSDRRILHFGVTKRPSAAWAAQQIREAFPFDAAPRYLLHDRDSIYGKEFSRVVEGMGIKEVRTAWRSPWQNPYVERVHGSIRRECLDHVIPLNERHLRRILRAYVEYYHESRTHLGLEKETPIPREVEPPQKGAKIVSIPQVGGLHHRYTRRAA